MKGWVDGRTVPPEMNAGPNTVVVIGAGPAGIGSALALRDAGLRPLLIDRAAFTEGGFDPREPHCFEGKSGVPSG